MSGKRRASVKPTAATNMAARRDGMTNEGAGDPNAQIKARVAGIMAKARSETQGRKLVSRLVGPAGLAFV